MKKYLLYLLLVLPVLSFADTIEHYMNIARNIPQMEMKADPQSQAWARSARNILILTSESIAESLMLANELAQKNQHPFFCLPTGAHLKAENVNELIQKTYQNMASGRPDMNQLSVSKIALLGLQKQYPCQNHNNLPQQPANQNTVSMQHQGSLNILG